MNMSIKQLGSNMTELQNTKANVSILFSYETPVAGWDCKGPFRTTEYFSRTTSKHINKYLKLYGGQNHCRQLDQSMIESICETWDVPEN